MLLHHGVEAWNQWRTENPDIRPDLSGADLSGAYLSRANLSGAHLVRAALIGTFLIRANLNGADLLEANLRWADLSEADLGEANLWWANLSGADLSGANLSGADLREVSCVRANLSGATLSGCNVYGISAWDVNLEGAVQTDLCITPGASRITVDNLKVAQFLYLLLSNEEMRDVLDTITSKVVLILGRFSEERKPILDALREALRRHLNGYIPVLFDFDPQTEKPVFDTVKTLANLARFVIADLTDPNMIRSELSYITANVPAVPVQPLIQEGAKLPVEYETWVLYRSFLPLYSYADLSHLLASLNESIITPVEAHVQARRL